MDRNSKRTDCHAPKNIVAEDYQFVAFDHMKIECIEDCKYALQQREAIQRHMEETGGTYSHHEHGGNCMVCGSARAVWTVLYYHEKTNSYVRVGQDCADKIDMSCGDANAFRKHIKNHMKAIAGNKKAIATLEAEGLSAAWELRNREWSSDFGFEERTIRDLVDKLIRYGSLSEKQIAFMRNLFKQITDRPAIQAQRAKEHELAEECPSGRVIIKGHVISKKSVEGYGGEMSTKVLIQSETGFKVYGSQFSRCQPGHYVEFKATVEVSEKDSKFGFFKRPVDMSPVTEDVS